MGRRILDPEGVVAAGSLKGDRVRSTSGEDLGRVKDLLIDAATGTVSYAIVALGGVLGLGERRFAVPWERVRIDTTNEELIMDLSRATLESSPALDQSAIDLDRIGLYYRREFGTGVAEPSAGRGTYGDEGSATAGTGRPPDEPKPRF